MATKTLYVGNLPYGTREEDLRALFEPYGPIEDVRIMSDKGFGFVDINEEMVATAIEATNGKDFNGRPLTVNEARPRSERRSFGGGGGGFGGGFGGRGGGGGSRGGRGDRSRGGGRRW